VRPDSEIRREVEQRLYWDSLVGDDLIDVAVNDGRVFLSGITGSAAEKRRAVIDAWISGVQSIDSSGLDVAAAVRDEALREAQDAGRPQREIRAAVQDALQADPRVAAFAIDIGIDNGRVTLRGTVDNILARRSAARDARNTVGVSSVNNLIKVRPRKASGDDDRIAAAVQRALLRNPYVGDYGIAVHVDDHVAYLEGTVDSYFDKAEAESIAERAAGVSAVRNHLQVSSPSTLTYDPYVSEWSIYDYPWYSVPEVYPRGDRAIRSDIESELFWSPFVDADRVSVAVEGGVATLTGTVDSTSENHAAVQNALQGGATRVIDRLAVKSHAQP
jgi:osmotically-inducible protein OsmY